MTILKEIHKEFLDSQQKLIHEIVRDTPRNRRIRQRRTCGELLVSIGKDHGISRERVRQICADIPDIRRIRNAIDKRINPIIGKERRAYAVVAAFHANYKKGKKDDCWIWQGLTHKVTGYGIQIAGQKTVFANVGILAHRRAWYLANRSKPPRGRSTHIMHTCDNEACVNPRHLILGTPKMNHDDAVAKGRKALRWSTTKLSDGDVREIRKNYRKPIDCVVLAKKYGVSTSLIYRIAKGYARLGKQKGLSRKLTDYQAKAIRYMHSTGRWSITKLASHYGIARTTTYNVIRHITYKETP